MAARLRQITAVAAIATLIGTPGVLSACMAVCGGAAHAVHEPAKQAGSHCAAPAAEPAAHAHAGAVSHRWQSPAVGSADRQTARHAGECCDGPLRVQPPLMPAARSELTASPVLSPVLVGDAFAAVESPRTIDRVRPVNRPVAAAPLVLRI